MSVSFILKRVEDWAAVIRACRSLGEAREIHSKVASSSCFHGDKLYLSNLLIEMYGRCGSFQDAYLMFLRLHVKNGFSWKLLLLACLQNVNTNPTYLHKAFEIFHQLPYGPDPVSATALLSAYSQSPGTSFEQALHFFSNCLPSRDLITWNCILRAAVQRGSTTEDAETCFQRMPCTSLVSWNSMLAAYVQRGDTVSAELVFLTMPERNVITWTSMIRLTWEWFDRMPAWNLVAWNSRLAAAENTDEATSVFIAMSGRDVISWTILLAAYVSNDMVGNARDSYSRMPCHDTASTTTMSQLHVGALTSGFDSDVVWWNSLLASRHELFHQMPARDVVAWNTLLALAVEDEVGNAEEVFTRMPQWNNVSMNQMLTALARKGEAEGAKRLLDSMNCGRNSVSWSITVEAFTNAGRTLEALWILEKMPQHNVLPWTSLISAYANIGQMDISWSLFERLPVRDLVTWNAMIAAQAQSGEADCARKVFVRMAARNIISWTAAIAADAQNGQQQKAVSLLQDMLHQGIQGDPSVFQCILFGCSHSGDVGTCVFWLHSIIRDHGIIPSKEHYGSIVDALGRAGSLNHAKELVDIMPFEPDVEWTSLIIHT